jgi:tetratricopeptide (TPR) repeat protein
MLPIYYRSAMRKQIRTWTGIFALLAAIILSGCNLLPRRNETSYLKRGRDLRGAGQYSRALLEFRNAARLAPSDGEPYYEIGLTEMRTGDYAGAASAFRQCLERDPRHAGARLKTAELMATSLNPETLRRASVDLSELLGIFPQDVEAAGALAIAEWKLGDREEAMERLDRTLRDFPADLSSSMLLAKMKLGQQDLQGAEEVLQKASAGAPKSSAAALALGEFYLVSGQVSKAEPEILRAVQLDSKNVQALLALAAVQINKNSPDAAEETYRRIAAAPGRQYKPLHALFLFQQGRRDQAINELRELVRKDPGDVAMRTRLIAALLETGRLAEAGKALAAALAANPRDTEALSQRGALRLAAGNLTEAQQDLEQVVALQRDDAAAHLTLARIHRSQGRSLNERRELTEALRLQPVLLPARLELARNHVTAGQPKDALQVLDEAPRAQQKAISLAVERNWALLAMNDIPALRRSLDEAMAEARRPDLVLQLALLQLANRDYAGAASSAEEVLKGNPSDARAARVLVESYTARNQAGKALERLRQLALDAPGSAHLQHMLGLWLASAGDLTGAARQFEAALRADPRFSAAELALAEIEYRQQRTDAARSRLQKVAAREPGNTRVLLALAAIDKNTGNHEQAILHYRAALASDGNNLVALNNLAIELTRSSPDEALGLAQRALEQAPENPAVQDTLGWIYYRKGIYQTAAK